MNETQTKQNIQNLLSENPSNRILINIQNEGEKVKNNKK